MLISYTVANSFLITTPLEATLIELDMYTVRDIARNTSLYRSFQET
jgi:hypothetical protein